MTVVLSAGRNSPIRTAVRIAASRPSASEREAANRWKAKCLPSCSYSKPNVLSGACVMAEVTYPC